MKRSDIIYSALIIVCAMAAIFPSSARSATLRKGPYLIYAGKNTEMTVLWQLDVISADSIRWGTDLAYSTGSAISTEYGTDHQHKYTITNLAPGTEYFYQVKLSSGQSFDASFRTAPPASDTTLKFLCYGDTRSYPAIHNQVADSMLSAVAKDNGYKTFVLVNGDLTISGDVENNWTNEIFGRSYTRITQLMATLPYQTCIGNHEGAGVLFQKYFPYPYVANRYFSFDYGPAHFVVLDQYVSYSPGSAQYQWLENDLAASTKAWKFLSFHEPGWTAGGGHINNLNVQQYIEPVCEKYNVRLVLCGHNHYYSRSRVVAANGDTIMHITTGGGGAPLYNPDASISNVVTATKANHFCKLNILNSTTLELTAVGLDGGILDDFLVHRVTPVIENIGVTNISLTGATIGWNTQTSANTVLEYGTTENYGNTIVGTAGVTNHSVVLSTLQPNTVYHYRVHSENAVSEDATFQTPPVVIVKINVTFRLNMRVARLKHTFRPDQGDVVTVRGNFNNGGTGDTLTDADDDSVYTATVSIPRDSTLSYKFWKTLRTGTDAESVSRSAALGGADTLLPAVYFNNDSSKPGITIPIKRRWNMISVPVETNTPLKTMLFPTATSNAFAYAGGAYLQSDTLVHAQGYWLKFPADDSVRVDGNPYTADTITAAGGWNLIGASSTPIQVSTITTEPAGILQGSFWGYSNGYIASDTLSPGQGYWIRLNGNGRIVLK